MNSSCQQSCTKNTHPREKKPHTEEEHMRTEATGDIQRLCSRQTIPDGRGMLLVRCASTMHFHRTLIFLNKSRPRAIQMLLLLMTNVVHTPFCANKPKRPSVGRPIFKLPSYISKQQYCQQRRHDLLPNQQFICKERSCKMEGASSNDFSTVVHH